MVSKMNCHPDRSVGSLKFSRPALTRLNHVEIVSRNAEAGGSHRQSSAGSVIFAGACALQSGRLRFSSSSAGRRFYSLRRDWSSRTTQLTATAPHLPAPCWLASRSAGCKARLLRCCDSVAGTNSRGPVSPATQALHRDHPQPASDWFLRDRSDRDQSQSIRRSTGRSCPLQKTRIDLPAARTAGWPVWLVRSRWEKSSPPAWAAAPAVPGARCKCPWLRRKPDLRLRNVCCKPPTRPPQWRSKRPRPHWLE